MEEAPGTLLVVLAIAFLGPLAATFLARFRLPPLVFEIMLGIVVGPHLLDLVEVSEPIALLADLGLAALIFIAGFELDIARIKGAPAKLALVGWALSLAVGLAIGLVLQATGVIVSELYVGVALSTTALGTLLPIMRDAGLLPTRFGANVLAIGSVGEFGPILAVALVLGSASPARASESLFAFAAIAVVGLFIVSRVQQGRLQQALSATLRSSGQLYIRLALLMIALMTFAAAELGLDFLLGAFTAGVLYRILLTASASHAEQEALESKLEAVAFGYMVPIFFVITGVRFDLDALTSSPPALLKVPLFLALLFVVRALPTLLLYRSEIPDARQRLGLSFLSATALPLVVAITTIGVAAEQMRPSTAAALVGAGMLSVVIFPIVGTSLAPKPEPGDLA